MGVAKEKVFATLGVKAIDDIGLEHLEVLIGYANAIREGDTTIDEVFNPPAQTAARSEPLDPFKKPETATPEPAAQ